MYPVCIAIHRWRRHCRRLLGAWALSRATMEGPSWRSRRSVRRGSTRSRGCTTATRRCTAASSAWETWPGRRAAVCCWRQLSARFSVRLSFGGEALWCHDHFGATITPAARAALAFCHRLLPASRHFLTHAQLLQHEETCPVARVLGDMPSCFSVRRCTQAISFAMMCLGHAMP